MGRLDLHQLLTTLVLVCTVTSPSCGERQKQTWPSRTYPGNLQFPDHPDLAYFSELLDGKAITPFEPGYLNESYTHNIRVSRLPGIIVEPTTIEDIQRSILWARKYNLHLSIRSSGHDYIGRSSHDGSLNLNLKMMKDIRVNLNSDRNKAGEVTVQTGASWLEVYEEVEKHQGPDESGKGSVGRLVVGGSAHTVAMGGYTQGGGHSPIGRMFGLAVDNLLEATIVTVDGKVHTLNSTTTLTRDLDGSMQESDDTSLFWAIRGGGGGTWGVVVDFTFKLHYAPERFRNLLVVIPTLDGNGKRINKEAMEFTLQQVNQLSPEWGGYVMTSASPVQGTIYKGSLALFLNHQGSNSSASNHEIDALLKHPSVIYVSETFYHTFLGYERTAYDAPYYVSYIFNSLIQSSTISNNVTLSAYVDLLLDMLEAGIGGTGTMIGGNMAKFAGNQTAVNPGFRSGIMSASSGVSWPVPSVSDEATIEKALYFAAKLYPFGLGSYINEPAEDMPDWKQKFWGDDTYKSLLAIKMKYDPDNYLWCHNCVGSDLGQGYASTPSQGHPGKPSPNQFQPAVEFDDIKSRSKTTPASIFVNPVIG